MRATPHEVAAFEQHQWERMHAARVYSRYGEWCYFIPPEVTWEEVIAYLGYWEKQDVVAQVQFYRDEGDWPDLLQVYGTFLPLTPTSMKPSYSFGHQFYPNPECIDEKGRRLLSFFSDYPPYGQDRPLRKWEMVNLMKHFVANEGGAYQCNWLFGEVAPSLPFLETCEALAW